jgi:hypothetical protein
MITVWQLRVEAHGSKVAKGAIQMASTTLACGTDLPCDEGALFPPAKLSLQIRYNRVVRRSLAISLLLLFSLPLIAPLLALQAGANGNLPACCRRNGAHHCAMQIPNASQQMHLSAVHERCPAYPKVVTSAKRNDLSFQTSAILIAGALVHPSIKIQPATLAQQALYRSQSQRGPPALRV